MTTYIHMLANYVYGRSTTLLHNGDIVTSAEGMQQGDPLGPYGFSLALQNLVSKMTSEINCWYLDDGCIAGPVEQVSKDSESIQSLQTDLGLSVNTLKCELFDPLSLCRDHDYQLFKHMKVISTNGAILRCHFNDAAEAATLHCISLTH